MANIEDWVSIKWHPDDPPLVGQIIREERGFLIIRTMDGQASPFLPRSMHSVEVIPEPKSRNNFLNSLWGLMSRHKLKTLFVSGIIIDFCAIFHNFELVER